MESRSTWTDARLDDRFDHIDTELTQLRNEMREGFGDVRTEMREGFSDVRAEINELRGIMIRFNGAMVVGLLGVLAAVVLRG